MDIYELWEEDIDSHFAVPRFVSVHRTLEGAKKAIPERLLKLEIPPYGDFIFDCRYYKIKKGRLED